MEIETFEDKKKGEKDKIRTNIQKIIKSGEPWLGHLTLQDAKKIFNLNLDGDTPKIDPFFLNDNEFSYKVTTHNPLIDERNITIKIFKNTSKK